jgi:hypothetical protein
MSDRGYPPKPHQTSIPAATHRLIVESALTGQLWLLCRGSEYDCRTYLDEWLETNVLAPGHAVLVVATCDIRPTPYPITILERTTP